MADNKRRGRFGKGSHDDANQSIFDLFEPPPEQDDTASFGKIPVIRDGDSLDLTDSAFLESKVSAEAEAAGLAHWTEPPTGQIPASLGANQTAGDVKGPSWRGDEPNWDGPDLSDVFADTDAITHDRIIDLDDDDLLAEAPMPPRPARPAPVRRPVADAAPTAPRRQAPAPVQAQVSPAAPSVFDTPPGSSPLGASNAPPAPAPVGNGRTGRRDGADLAPAASPRQPPAPRRIVEGPLPAAAAPARDAVPPPARHAAPPPPAAGQPGQRAQQPAARQRADSPPRPAGAEQAPAGAPPRRGAHDFPSNGAASGAARRPAADPTGTAPSGAIPNGTTTGHGAMLEGPAELLDVEFATPAPTGQVPLARVSGGGNGAGHDRYHEAPDHQREVLPPELDVDYDDYDDYDEYDHYEDGGDGEGRSLLQSVLVGIALAAVVFVTLGFGPVPTMVLIGLLTLMAVMELFNAMRLAGLRPATLLGLVGAVALPAASYVRGDAGFPLVMGLAIVFGMLWYLTGADTERPVLNLGLTFTGILWIGGLAGFGALMVRAEDGVGLLLATIIITAASDTLAYLGGRAYGTKAFHSASPNKTWEGTITGFFGALFAGLAIWLTSSIGVFGEEFLPVMVLAAVVGVLAPIGDLAESLVKRDLGVKDMGTLLPGHGGILDRVDGLLFALPGAYYVAVVYALI